MEVMEASTDVVEASTWRVVGASVVFAEVFLEEIEKQYSFHVFRPNSDPSPKCRLYQSPLDGWCAKEVLNAVLGNVF